MKEFQKHRSDHFAHAELLDGYEDTDELIDKLDDIAHHIGNVIVEFNALESTVESLIAELLMFKVANNFYLGGPVSYKSIKYDANNEGGDDFLLKNGIQDENTGGIGLASSYDTRKNKYYPSAASWFSLKINSNPKWYYIYF